MTPAIVPPVNAPEHLEYPLSRTWEEGCEAGYVKGYMAALEEVGRWLHQQPMGCVVFVHMMAELPLKE